jgi:hypothetical protein
MLRRKRISQRAVWGKIRVKIKKWESVDYLLTIKCDGKYLLSRF